MGDHRRAAQGRERLEPAGRRQRLARGRLHGNKKTDQPFYSNDSPGWGIGQLDKDDVLDYAFTAEQMIIDTSDGNKVIAKHGPHTATIKGKSPRVHGNVPKKLVDRW